MPRSYCPPYSFPIGRQAGTGMGWSLYGKSLVVNPNTDLLSEDPSFNQMVQPSTTLQCVSSNLTIPTTEGTEEIIITYIDGLGRKCIKTGTFLPATTILSLTDENSFKFIESVTSVTTCSSEILVRPSDATTEAVIVLPAFKHGAVTFHRFPGSLSSYITGWSVRLEVSAVASEPVWVELRWYQNQEDCNCHDGPYEIIDSTYLLHSGAAATYVSAEYRKDFHPTIMLGPGGWFGVFGETDATEAYISLSVQGYDVLPMK